MRIGLANGCVTIQFCPCFNYLQHTRLWVAHGHAAPGHLGPRLTYRLLLVGTTPFRVLTCLGLVVATSPTGVPLEFSLPISTPIYPGSGSVLFSFPAPPIRYHSTPDANAPPSRAGPNSATALRPPHLSPPYSALVHVLHTPLQVVPVLMPSSCACTCIALFLSPRLRSVLPAPIHPPYRSSPISSRSPSAPVAPSRFVAPAFVSLIRYVTHPTSLDIVPL
ncbi:hypothetical protein B0H13DRAFT_2324373 [Mycena leptocephala]|nr:hypothetical protein B0H13DRAFT_2324373 [Mycena leptocephala]